ncbi:MAG TPA: hypothetical protein GX708_04380 [Gallicola sp.]|nr:hypothetical protein [Gallicola sp.]
MKEYKVTIPVDYVQGHLRYGHLEGIVEVENEEELKKLIESKEIEDYLSIEVDDYSVEDYGDVKYEDLQYKELKKENE